MGVPNGIMTKASLKYLFFWSWIQTITKNSFETQKSLESV